MNTQEVDKSVYFIVISKKRLAELLRKEQKLLFLKNAGVNDWEYYGDALFENKNSENLSFDDIISIPDEKLLKNIYEKQN